jgi:hypothetical protein
MNELTDLRKEIETLKKLLKDMSGTVAAELADLKKRVEKLEKGPPPTKRAEHAAALRDNLRPFSRPSIVNCIIANELESRLLRLWIAAPAIFVCATFGYKMPPALDGLSQAREQAEQVERAKQPGAAENFLTRYLQNLARFALRLHPIPF